ncbi:hypothetical protein JMN32_20530 [Fulvivirga sp. 29W222]|uniref:Uncharacterized protein n=1 Tax=Fulvivirga marina TaxID=2494733 RepID=A0A937KD23_9BACT|nr:hypothetical protein [Fulvivirga marina]MBL6448711.1 hypothetical protein [Fulvivirga marina]
MLNRLARLGMKRWTQSRFCFPELNTKLLQKVEELTLYLIEQNEVNKAQAKEIAELKEMVEQLVEADK